MIAENKRGSSRKIEVAETVSLLEEVIRQYMVQEMEQFAARHKDYAQDRLSRKFHSQFSLNIN